MSFIISATESEGKALPQSGLNQAVLVSIVDLGTQASEEFGPKRQVYLSFALPNQTHIFDEAKGPEPFHVGKTFTLSFHEKSALRKAVKGMLGADVRAASFDLESLLGKNFTLNLIEVEKGDKKYINIEAYAPLMSGMSPVEMETQIFSFSDYSVASLEKLPEWQQEKIKQAPEFSEVDLPF